MVGALLTPPVSPDAAAGVLFFNNIGTLAMCGHGLIGVVRTLAFTDRVTRGEICIDTPAGIVSAWLNEDDSVTIRNVPARLHAADVVVEVPGVGAVTGDIAWGGNWFFIVDAHDRTLDLANVGGLTRFTAAIRSEEAFLRQQFGTAYDDYGMVHCGFGTTREFDVPDRNWRAYEAVTVGAFAWLLPWARTAPEESSAQAAPKITILLALILSLSSSSAPLTQSKRCAPRDPWLRPRCEPA